MWRMPCFGLGMNATITGRWYDGSSPRQQEADAVLVNGRLLAAIALVGAGGLLAACQPTPTVGPVGGTGGSGGGGSGSAGAATVVPGPTLGGCPVFPKTNPWNQNIATLPVRPDS